VRDGTDLTLKDTESSRKKKSWFKKVEKGEFEREKGAGAVCAEAKETRKRML